MRFYYPNFTNDMWRIFGLCFYSDKLHFVDTEHKTFRLDLIVPFLNEHRIGMYDTATEVRRLKNTASDKDLEVVEPTDLKAMVDSLPELTDIVTTGQKATDVLVTYADARRDYAERWNTEFGREGSIWEETGVIGVTAPIYNDTISVSKNSPIMDADLIAALQQAFINIGNTDAGKQVIAIYSHNGYQKAQSSDYDNERAAQKLIQELTAAG